MKQRKQAVRSAWTLSYDRVMRNEGVPQSRTHGFVAESIEEAVELAARALRDEANISNPVAVRSVSLVGKESAARRRSKRIIKSLVVPEIRIRGNATFSSFKRFALAA